MTITPSSARSTHNRFAGGAIKSLVVAVSTQSTAFAGTPYDLGAGFSNFSMQVSGLISGSKILLQGSLNGANWTTLGSTAGYTSTAAPVLRSTSATPVQFVRLYGVTVSTGAARSVAGYIGVG